MKKKNNEKKKQKNKSHLKWRKGKIYCNWFGQPKLDFAILINYVWWHCHKCSFSSKNFNFTIAIVVFRVPLGISQSSQCLLKVLENPCKQNKNRLKNMAMLLYTYFYNISLNVLRPTFFHIYLLFLRSRSIGSNLGHKLTTFPIF